MRIREWIWGGLLVVGAMGGGALAQQQDVRTPAGSVGGELRLLASRAGVVFVGRVEKIEPKGGVVEVTFSVEQPVLGVVGGSYVMREWAGRWTGGQQHFLVGERAMFFLHAPGASGLSSAVDGMMGAVPVVPMGANGAALLDVRWLATRVRRAAGTPLMGTSGISEGRISEGRISEGGISRGEIAQAGISLGGIALADGVVVTRSWRTEGVAEPKGVRLPEGVMPQMESPGLSPLVSAGVASGKGVDDGQR